MICPLEKLKLLRRMKSRSIGTRGSGMASGRSGWFQPLEKSRQQTAWTDWVKKEAILSIRLKHDTNKATEERYHDLSIHEVH